MERVDYTKRLRALRVNYKSNKDMAKRLNISQGYLSRLLRGKRNPATMAKKTKQKVNASFNYYSQRYAYQLTAEVVINGEKTYRTGRLFDARGIEEEELDFAEELSEAYSVDEVLGFSIKRRSFA